MLRDIFKFLASLKLAMLLLAVIIVATAFGTYYESKYNADVARRMVYNHWWFDAWLTMLCVNLFCVAAIRYPWKPHQTGFVITHAGIIVLLVGGLIDRHFGIEGSVGLNRGQPPTNVMELLDQEIIVAADETSEPGRTPFKVNAILSEADCKFPLATPDPALKAEVLDIRPMNPVLEGIPAEDGVPMVQMNLRGAAMGQHDLWIALGDRRQLLPGVVMGFHHGMPGKKNPSPHALPQGEGKQQPGDDGDHAEPKKMVPRLERHTVFSLHDPTVVTQSGDATNAKTTLTLGEDGKNPELKLELLGKTFTYKVEEIIEKEVELEGLSPWRIFVYGYYPNYRRVEAGKVISVNKDPDNPAVVFDLLGPLVAAPTTPAGHAPHGHGGGRDLADANEPDFSFTLFLGDDDKLRYRVFSKRNGETIGDAQRDQPIVLKGWGPTDAELTPVQFLPKAKPIRRWRPLNIQAADRVAMLRNQRAGALCRVSYNGDTKEVWVPMTMPYRVFEGMKPERLRDWDGSPLDVKTLKTPVEVGGKKLQIAFCNRTTTLPFHIELKRFHAPIQEGMESSMSFMSFESVLAFNGAKDFVRITSASQFAGGKHASKDDPLLLIGAVAEQNASEIKMAFEDGSEIAIPRNEVVSVEQNTQKIFMNSPTNFPLDWHGPWFGSAYKFSQAGHKMNEGDANYSGVQVLRDPGWFPKWFGCLMICFGIFTMFYLKPYFSGRKAWKEEEARAVKGAVVAQAQAGEDAGKKAKNAAAV